MRLVNLLVTHAREPRRPGRFDAARPPWPEGHPFRHVLSSVLTPEVLGYGDFGLCGARIGGRFADLWAGYGALASFVPRILCPDCRRIFAASIQLDLPGVARG